MWITGPHLEYLLAALNADILREAATAAEYLQLARLGRSLHDPSIRHHVAVCAATALSNAAALAAEMVALGGVPPVALADEGGRPPARKPIEEYVSEARSALVHYTSRVAMAGRLGLPRLQEVFREIVLSKRKHLGHAGAIAASGVEPPEHKTNRRNSCE